MRHSIQLTHLDVLVTGESLTARSGCGRPSLPQKEVEFLKLRYQVAVDNGSLDVGRLLLQRTYAGDTALHLAVRSGSRALVEKLLQEHTADPNVRVSQLVLAVRDSSKMNGT